MNKVVKWGWLAIAMVLLVAAGVGGNIFEIGDGTSTDKDIEFKLGLGGSNPRIRATTAGLNFTNDGTNFLPFGSGTGGGTGGENVVKNPGFEIGETNWNNTGTGAFATTVVAANVGFGDASGDWDASAAADKLTSDVQITPNGIAGSLCIAEMFYKGGGTSDITMRVIDGSDVLIPGFTEVVVTDAATSFKRIFSEFICPAEGTSMKFQLEAAGDAPNLYIDNVHVGTKGITRGAVITEWEDFTPVFSTDTTWTINRAKLSQSGSNMLVDIAMVANVSGGGAENIYLAIPKSTTVLDTTTDMQIGEGHLRPNAGGDAHDISVIYDGTGWLMRTAPLYSGSNRITDNTIVSGDNITLQLRIPIAEWVGQGTVNMLNNSVIGSSDKMSVFGLTAVASTVSGVVKEITTWDTANLSLTGGGSFDGTTYTNASAGNYTIRASMRWGNAITATDAVIYIYKNGVGIKRSHYDFAATGGPSMSADFDTDLVEGDLITIWVSQNSGGGEDTRVADEELTFSVKRNSEISSESPLGFGLADAENAGLISNQTENGRVFVTLADGGAAANCSPSDTTAEFCSVAGNTFGRGDAYPYKTTSGQWRLKFNITIELASAAAVTNFEISGVTFDFSQSISILCANDLDGGSNVAGHAFVNRTGNLIKTTCSTSRDAKMLSGDVALTSKPLWL